MSFSPITQVLITGERSKLPTDYHALFDEQQPLPPGILFFEERKTAGTIFWRLLLGISLLGIGVLERCSTPSSSRQTQPQIGDPNKG